MVCERSNPENAIIFCIEIWEHLETILDHEINRLAVVGCRIIHHLFKIFPEGHTSVIPRLTVPLAHLCVPDFGHKKLADVQ